MAKTISGWALADSKNDLGGRDLAVRTNNMNPLVVYKETFTYGTGVVTDCYGSPIDFIPAGIDFTVLFVQNNTMSAAGDIVLQGSLDQTTWNTVKDDLVAYAAAADSTGQYTAAKHDVDANVEYPYYRLFQDDDALHSTSTGTAKTADLYLMFSKKGISE